MRNGVRAGRRQRLGRDQATSRTRSPRPVLQHRRVGSRRRRGKHHYADRQGWSEGQVQPPAEFGAGGLAPTPSGPTARGSRPVWRRGPVIALVAVLLVAAAVAVPLALVAGKISTSRGSGPTSTAQQPSALAKLTATAIVAKTIAAAKAAGSFTETIKYSTDPSSNIVISVAKNGMAVELGSRSPDEVVIGKTAYFTSPAMLGIMGVVPAVATAGPNATRWFSDPVTAAGVRIFDDQVSSPAQLDTLALSNPRVESTTGGEVKLIGGFPAAPGVRLSLVGIRATLTVSETAPYFPVQLHFVSAGDEDFTDWGAVPALSPPRAPAPLSSILKPTSDQAVLSQLTAAQSELPSGYSAAVIPGGEEVIGQVTLNFCSNSYASEKLRVARRQVAVIDPAGDSSEFGTEAVVYSSAGGTTEAFAEIVHAASHCTAGVTPVPIGSSWPSVPGVQLLGYWSSSKIPTGQAVSTVVYLRRGAVLLGLYFTATSPTSLTFPVAASTSIETISRFFEKRLAGLPASAVG